VELTAECAINTTR